MILPDRLFSEGQTVCLLRVKLERVLNEASRSVRQYEIIVFRDSSEYMTKPIQYVQYVPGIKHITPFTSVTDIWGCALRIDAAVKLCIINKQQRIQQI